jgi:hypothetical protein
VSFQLLDRKSLPTNTSQPRGAQGWYSLFLLSLFLTCIHEPSAGIPLSRVSSAAVETKPDCQSEAWGTRAVFWDALEGGAC